MAFQSPLPLTLNGHVHATLIHDPALPPSTVIKAGTPFQVHLDWGIDGTSVPFIAGTFHVTAYFERYGGGPEPEFGPIAVPVVSVPLVGNTRHYTTHIPVPAGLPAGAYSLMVLITYTDTVGAPGPIAGMPDAEIIIQVYP
jgi:hypothetical protein